jgi:hypothetical protein
MNPRKYRSRPPTGAGHKSGQVLTVAPSDDVPPPSELVELIPVGSVLVLEVAPESDANIEQDKKAAARRSAFLTELNGRAALAPATSSAQQDALNLDPWGEVLADASVWPEFTAFLTRRNADALPQGRSALRYGGAPLASYWLKTENSGLRTSAVEWLRSHWRQEWEKLSDEAKRAVVEDSEERAARAEAALDVISGVVRPFQKTDSDPETPKTR